MNSVNYEQRAKYEVPWLASKDGQWDSMKTKWEHERELKENPSRSESNGDKKRCEECGVKFEDPEEAEKHRVAEHEKVETSDTYTCIQCQVRSLYMYTYCNLIPYMIYEFKYCCNHKSIAKRSCQILFY